MNESKVPVCDAWNLLADVATNVESVEHVNEVRVCLSVVGVLLERC